MLGRLKRRRRTAQITTDFARVLAGQVSVGLALEADEATRDTPAALVATAERARMALTSVGLMLRNASSDPIVREILDHPTFVRRGDGGEGPARLGGSVTLSRGA
jgi:hypothetical protein